jgi:predicted dehydrogenase
VTAAEAGKHLLLEKPVATSVEAARRVAAAASANGIASVVFSTARFQPEFRSWTERMAASGPWRTAWCTRIGATLTPDNPFNTPWRREKGGLWDIGPHVVAALEGGLGPIVEVASAVRGEKDLTHLCFRHESGATSTATISLEADPRAEHSSTMFLGDAEVVELPGRQTPAERAHQTAVEELMESAASGRAHPADVHWGTHVVELLAAAEHLAGPKR